MLQELGNAAIGYLSIRRLRAFPRVLVQVLRDPVYDVEDFISTLKATYGKIEITNHSTLPLMRL